MKIKNVITLTALSAMILSGCSSEPEASEPKKSINTEEYKPVPEQKDPVVSPEAYTKIQEYFANWELPTEGVLPKDHEFYKGWEERNVVIYDNGYIFDKETKKYEGRISLKESNYATPVATPDQFDGIVMTLMPVLMSDLKVMDRVEVPKTSETLNWSGDYLESLNRNSVAIINQFKEIIKYSSNEDFLKASEEILKEAEALQQRTNDINKEETLGSLDDVETQYKRLDGKIRLLNASTESL